MPKINNTYGSGYYIDKDADYARFEQDEKRRERERARRLSALAGKDSVILNDELRTKMTFAVPLHLSCGHCGSYIARGKHVYINKYRARKEEFQNPAFYGESNTFGDQPVPLEPSAPADKKKTFVDFLGIPVWELRFRCPSCRSYVYIRSDPENAIETGGYVPFKNCTLLAGDIHQHQNVANEEADDLNRPPETEEEAQMDPLMLRDHRAVTRTLEILGHLGDDADDRKAELLAALTEDQRLLMGKMHSEFLTASAGEMKALLRQRLVKQDKDLKSARQAREQVNIRSLLSIAMSDESAEPEGGEPLKDAFEDLLNRQLPGGKRPRVKEENPDSGLMELCDVERILDSKTDNKTATGKPSSIPPLDNMHAAVKQESEVRKPVETKKDVSNDEFFANIF